MGLSQKPRRHVDWTEAGIVGGVSGVYAPPERSES